MRVATSSTAITRTPESRLRSHQGTPWRSPFPKGEGREEIPVFTLLSIKNDKVTDILMLNEEASHLPSPLGKGDGMLSSQVQHFFETKSKGEM